MADSGSSRLRRLRAEIHAELVRVDRTVAELDAAAPKLAAPSAERLVMYGVAALLETFYTGIEKVLLRIASTVGDVPEGPAWHRQLLEIMVLEVPRVRPAALARESGAALEEYLAFRHRFRNLYLFDLRPELVSALVARTGEVWAQARADLALFADAIERIADELDR